ncbi:MAG: polyphosphate:AMP phosphotransferase [Actinomycetia bacterium]|nr:polyphosphate:AMP phosphotransferase [Actinomycetes bacterium]
MITGYAKAKKVSKADYKKRVETLRVDLINAQYDLKSADFPLVIVIAGDDRVGAAEVVNRLNQWMDSRYLRTQVLGDPSEEEAQHPRFWRLWQSIPPKGQAALWVGGLMRMVSAYLANEVSKSELHSWATNLRQFQDELIADGALILKFYIHTPAKLQKKRMKKAKKNDRAWRYHARDWQTADAMSDGLPVMEEVLRETTTRGAPWHIIEGSSRRTRDLLIGEAIQASIQYRLEQEQPAGIALPPSSFSDAPDVTSEVDLSASIDRADYDVELEELQGELHSLSHRAQKKGVSSVLAFEGWDAGGKGGAIRRVTAGLEAGDYRVIPVAAPTQEELRYPYLWRFWRNLPGEGQVAIFDRTWYGRVLVERVEGFATDADWQRAYAEIVNFEQQLVDRGLYVGKFWLQISKDEQLARFKSRENTPYKKHKITEEDYRNREKWDQYVIAVNEMISRTSTPLAPWTLVPANDKYSARLTVLRTVNEGLRAAIKRAS